MGYAIVAIHPTVLSNLLSDHPGRTVYHSVKQNGIPEGSRIQGISWDQDKTHILVTIESESIADEFDAVDLPPIEMAAYIIEREGEVVGAVAN